MSRLPLRSLSKNRDWPSDTRAAFWLGSGPIGIAPHCPIVRRSSTSSDGSSGGSTVLVRSQPAAKRRAATHSVRAGTSIIDRIIVASSPYGK
jgi:hypothetical protein